MLKCAVGPNRNTSFPDKPFLSDHMVSCGTLQPDILQCPREGEMHCITNNGLAVLVLMH